MILRPWLSVSAAGLSLIVLLGVAASAGDWPAADPQLRAMSDELARSKNLSLSTLDKPYFIQYTSSDVEQVSLAASLGGITLTQQVHARRPGIVVRVGDYQFDNTNFIQSGSGSFGYFPLDDDYQVMRTELWRTTDMVYKAATDQITRKRNALRELADPDKTPDLARVEAVQVIEPPSRAKADAKQWAATVKQMSSVFVAHPAVSESSVRLLAIGSTYRLVNTEGTVVRIPQNVSDLAIRSSAVLADGSRVWDHRILTGLEPQELPEKARLIQETEALARETETLKNAPDGDDYTGPVLFEKQAAAQMMAQVLTDALVLRRKPITPPEARESGDSLESVWSSRLGSKVLPEWMNLRDDPSEEKFRGTILAGHYTVDDEGVRAGKVNLVENGTLRNFLLSREPVRTFTASNGHGRLPGPFGAELATLGNLFVDSSHTVPPGKLRALLLEKVKATGLPYGIVVRQLDFPSTAPFAELQNIARQLQKNGYARSLTPPLVAVRVYPDGHEELVRSLRFREFSAKDLRDIDAASDDPFVLNYLNTGIAFNIADLGVDATTSSVICPSLLLDTVELTRAEGEAGARPLVPAPALEASK